MQTLKTLFATLRPPFLLLTGVCVALGAAVVYHQSGGVDWPRVGLVLLGALCAHGGVNMLNEFLDFRSGLDMTTERTPFSGGSGALPADPGSAYVVLGGALTLLMIVKGVGWLLLPKAGEGLLAIGIIGLAVILLYTGPINRNRWACLVAPGLGFGVLMVAGTVVALGGTLDRFALYTLLPPFMLVSGLLLLNQFPDQEADAAAGRRHLVVVSGPQVAGRWFGAMVFSAYLWIALLGLSGALPTAVLIALLPLPLAVSVVKTVAGKRSGALERTRLVEAMGRNVALTLATPALMAAGIVLGA